MIDRDCNARLADFGSITISDPAIISSCGGTPRWMSPELLNLNVPDLETSPRTKSSGCYGLGMVVYKVLSGKEPFHGYNKYTAALKVSKGKRPERSEEGLFTDDIWSVLEHCWKANPGDHPNVNCVLQCLEETSGS